MNSDTIRTVIEIVPGWAFTDDAHGGLFVESLEGYKCALPGSNEMLDALAAAGCREIKRIARERKQPWLWANMVTELRRQGLDKDDTDFWLEAIAEFVKGGGFDESI